MKSHRNDRNRDAVSGWEDDGGAGGTDAARTTDNAPAAHDSEQRRLDTSHHSDIRGSIATTTFIKPDRSEKPGRTETFSNSGLRAGSLDATASLQTGEHVRRGRGARRRRIAGGTEGGDRIRSSLFSTRGLHS